MSLLRRTLRFPAQPSTTFRTSQRLPLTARPFSQSTLRSYPRKDSQDKDSINTEATEYSKSGTDDQSASATENTAFDPKTTSPEAEHRQANREVGGDESANPLNVSPANQEVSKPRGQQEGGPEGSSKETGGKRDNSDRERTSGGASPPKSGSGQHGGGGGSS
ncbi:hypothetical protein MBLNU230_g3744t1 [Neophaeotheca triangularis]